MSQTNLTLSIQSYKKFSTIIARTIILVISLLFYINSWAANVAITMDDPNVYLTPLLTPLQRDQKIRDTLKKNHLKIVLFVCGMRVDSPAGKALLQHWNDEKQILGNHTYSHQPIDSMGETTFEFDTLKNENLIKEYPEFQKIFRFPCLKEGDKIETRDAFRSFLKNHHYINGSVSIDASDWYISQRLEAKLAKDPHADLSPYKKYYLDHIWGRAQYYDNLAKAVLHRSPSHILLIHHNLLNALFLNDLIQMFKQKGWHVIDAEKAYQDPIYKIQPPTIPAGESIIWSLAKASGRFDAKLRYPGEDEVYEKGPMDKLGL